VTAQSKRTELTVYLRAAAEYELGLPFFIEVTLANETQASDYYHLTDCDPFSPPFPIELTFTEGHRRVPLPSRSPSHDENRHGFDLSPGESRTFVLDVAELSPPLKTGHWQVQACWVMRHETPRSTPVAVVLTAGNAADAPLLAQLRNAGDARTSSWANLIKTPGALEGAALRSLSERASRALVPYLIVHQAVHGPEPLSAFPPEFLASHAQGPSQGPWASEAGVLTYELMWARRAADLAARKAELLSRWPGVAFRVQEIEAGAGLLTTLRDEYGPTR
jgi:hypothetical protein